MDTSRDPYPNTPATPGSSDRETPPSPGTPDEGAADFESLPDSLILNILNYLTPFEVARVYQCSRRLSRISSDDILWRRLFHRYFCLQPIFASPIGHKSWREEFIRLIDEIPILEAQVLTEHTDQVLHVSHSHDGEVFATTSKDAMVHVWNSTHPVTLKDSQDMKRFAWKYTQFSQFNETDTLLLVSGVLFGLQSTCGEIAVFSLEGEFELQCRVKNKPYDIFGSWYSESYLFSGDLHWLGHLVSKSVLWLNKASQEIESERIAIMNQMYRFYNPKASSVRSILVTNCVDAPPPPPPEVAPSVEDQPTSSRYVKVVTSGNPPSSSHCRSQSLPAESDLISINSRGCKGTLQGAFQNWKPLNNIADINYTSEYRSMQQKEKDANVSRTSGDNARSSPKRFKSIDETESDNTESNRESEESLTGDGDDERNEKDGNDENEKNSPTASPSQSDGPQSPTSDSSSSTSSSSAGAHAKDRSRSAPLQRDDSDEIIDPRDKWLIFTCGSKTYTPHQIGFKRIRPFKFNSRMDPGPTVPERFAELKRRQELAGSADMPQEERVDYTNYSQVADRFDSIDHIIDLHGHIIGMTVSPEHRYLYVNSRPWPGNYTISDPLDPPPIAQEIDIHVIDLTTLRQVGMMRRAHRAYTPNEECFFIFLDASNYYLASGAEDKHAYMWERNYGISLAKLPHADVVNSVAFSPRNPEMLISVSDDHTIKIWRSKRQCRELGIKTEGLMEGVKLYLTPRPTYATYVSVVTK